MIRRLASATVVFLLAALCAASCTNKNTAGDPCTTSKDCGDLSCINGTCGRVSGEEEICPLGQHQCSGTQLTCATWGGGFPICSRFPCKVGADCPSGRCETTIPGGVCFPKTLLVDGG